jgi:hypothetical protein
VVETGPQAIQGPSRGFVAEAVVDSHNDATTTKLKVVLAQFDSATNADNNYEGHRFATLAGTGTDKTHEVDVAALSNLVTGKAFSVMGASTALVMFAKGSYVSLVLMTGRAPSFDEVDRVALDQYSRLP